MSINHAKLMDNIEDRLYRYRAKRLRFLINGDKYFAGINYALNTEKIRSFDALLNDLTRVLSMDHLKLCKGVRYIFSQEGNLMSSITDFQDGHTYICSSTDTFITTEYRNSNGMLNWLIRNSACISERVRSKRVLLSPPPPRQQQQQQHKTSHNNNNVNDSQHLSNQTINRTPRSNNNTSNSLAAKRTPKKAVDTTKLSHNQKCDTPQAKTNLAIVSESAQKQRAIGTNSPQPLNHSASGKLVANQINKTLFETRVIDKYDIGRPIGDGHFSIVYCCMNKATQEFCALKLIDKLKCREVTIYNEVKILKQLNHPNIVKLLEEFDYSKQLYLILELVQDGDLFDAISSVTQFSEEDAATMIHNLSSALTYLHKQGIVHRDIKPENLLISVQEDGSQSVKLADFGLAVEVGSEPLYGVCGTAIYVSPEILNETGYDYKVDVWSTGVICFILLCGYPPFILEDESNQDELFDAILAGDFDFAPNYWSKISQHAKNLIKCMLTVDPEKRYTAEQVFTHPWTMGTSSNFDGIDPMNISRKIALQSQ